MEDLDSYGAIANVEQAGLAYTLYDTPAGTRQNCTLYLLPRLVVAKVFALQAALSRHNLCSIASGHSTYLVTDVDVNSRQDLALYCYTSLARHCNSIRRQAVRTAHKSAVALLGFGRQS